VLSESWFAVVVLIRNPMLSLSFVCPDIMKVYKNVLGCMWKMAFLLPILISWMPCTNHLGSSTLGHQLLRWGMPLDFVSGDFYCPTFTRGRYIMYSFNHRFHPLFPSLFESSVPPPNPPYPLPVELVPVAFCKGYLISVNLSGVSS
jgi:hypothetical protein